MGNRYNIFGLPLASKGDQRLLEELVGYYNKGLIGWMQIYVKPGTIVSDVGIFKDTPLNIIVHAASESHGFNIPDGLTDVNKQIIDEAFLAAEELGSQFIIFHAGYFRERLGGKTYAESKELDEKIDRSMNYIKEQQAGNQPGPPPSVLFENMLMWENGHETWFNSPLELSFWMTQYQWAGFCFDLSIAAQRVNCYPFHMIDPPQRRVVEPLFDRFYYLKDGVLIPDTLTQGDIYQEKFRHQSFTEQFLEIKPKIVHTRGISYGDLIRYPQGFSQLNLDQWELALPYCHRNNVPFIIEALEEKNYQKGLEFVTDYFDRLMSENAERSI